MRVDSPSRGGLLAAFAPIPKARATAIAKRLNILGERCTYVVPSHDPASPDFDSLRYWRSPMWLIVNYMIVDGLQNAGETATANRIIADSLKLIEHSGFAEYYDPMDGTPCGGGRFTGTAAMVIELIQ